MIVEIDLTDIVQTNSKDEIFNFISAGFGEIGQQDLQVKTMICNPNDKIMLVEINRYTHSQENLTADPSNFWGAVYYCDENIEPLHIKLVSN